MAKSKLIDNEIDGYVEEPTIGGTPRIRKIVKGNSVFEFMVGGPPRPIGHVENGIAYEIIIGGPPKYLGPVKYK